ncbi:permease prefix domain 1-containing protein [Actinotalea caeni]
MTSPAPSPSRPTDRKDTRMSTLTDRYVYAATRLVQSEDERKELQLELRERIEDTISALEAGGLDRESAERQALTDLGDPLRVTAEYRQRPLHLIGPRFFYMWLRILVIAVSVTAPIVLAINVLVAVSAGETVGQVIVGGFGNAIAVAIHVAFWVTLVFAVVERVAPDSADAWTPDLLPQLPSGGGRGRADLIASIVCLVIFGALLAWQHLGSPFLVDGARVPILDPALWVPELWLVVGLLVLEAVHAFWVYRAGWTWPTALTNVALSVAFAVVVLPVLLQDRLLNPAFVQMQGWEDWTGTGTMIVAAGVVIVTVWESIAGVVRTLRGENAGRA